MVGWAALTLFTNWFPMVGRSIPLCFNLSFNGVHAPPLFSKCFRWGVWFHWLWWAAFPFVFRSTNWGNGSLCFHLFFNCFSLSFNGSLNDKVWFPLFSIIFRWWGIFFAGCVGLLYLCAIIHLLMVGHGFNLFPCVFQLPSTVWRAVLPLFPIVSRWWVIIPLSCSICLLRGRHWETNEKSGKQPHPHLREQLKMKKGKHARPSKKKQLKTNGK